MPFIAAAIGAAVSIGASVMGAKAKKKGLKRAGDNVWQMYEESKSYLEPWQERGVWAAGELQQIIKEGPPEFTGSPEYNFAVREGQNARESAAAASGTLDSGGFQKGITAWGQGMAQSGYQQFLQNFQNMRINPLYQMSIQGQNAASNMAQMAMKTGDTLGTLEIGKGDVNAGLWTILKNVAMGSLSSAAGSGMFDTANASSASVAPTANPYGEMYQASAKAPISEYQFTHPYGNS